MTRAILRFILIIILIFFGIISYFSIFGFETNKFNPLIKSNLKNIDKNLDVNLKEVKILLDLSNLSLNAKTLGPVIIYNDNKIDLEFIKTQIPLSSIIKKQISSSNISISTKLIKIKNVISFLQSIKNSPELIIINKLIKKGFVIADLNFKFDDNGDLKKDYEVKGLIKEGKLNILNNQVINNINLSFNVSNSKKILSDIKFSYDDIKINSEKFIISNKGSNFFVKGDLKTQTVLIKENEISKYINFKDNFGFESIKFSSKNDIQFSLSKNFKIKNYEIKSSLNLDYLNLKNLFNLRYFFPDIKEEVTIKNNQIDLKLKNDFFEMSGSGKILLQNEEDQIIYNLKRKNNQFIFDTKFVFSNNPIIINLLNFKNFYKNKSILNLIGQYELNEKFTLKKVSYVNGRNIIKIDNLNFDRDNKISSIDNINIDLVDKFDEKIDLEITRNGKNYKIGGKKFNASILLEDLITKDSEKKLDIFSGNINLEINLKEVLVEEDEIINNLKGEIKFKENDINYAKLNGFFSKNQNLSFTVIKKNRQKVTTFFSEKAGPFVKKFDFIKGFEGGSIDFYSVENENSDKSNSQIKLYDFKLKEVPALTKILTLASLQGIADLLSGDGIRFDDFEMKFQNQKNLLTINEIYAIGPAISILMEGYVEKNNLISLRGTLVPATTINKAIGSIPVLGEILVGKKTGEGVFGVSFKIKGPPKNTETTVNPIKTLTPRFITRTLEKIKKSK